MSTAIYYSGPGKLAFDGATFWPQGENGKIIYSITQEKNDAASGMRGRVASTLGNSEGKISITPFDQWSLLSVLYPTYLGVTTGSNAAALAIGTRPHNPPFGGAAVADIPATLWNPEGSGIVVNRCAIIKHPDLHLGVDKALYGAIELAVLPKTTAGVMAAIGSANAFHTVTEAAGALADPSATAGSISTFIREPWTGAIASGDTGFITGLEAEDEWTVSCNVKYNAVKKQKQTIAYTLSSVEFMAKCRPFGPTWTNITAAVDTGRLLGSRWAFPTFNAAPTAAVNLVLTSASGKTITLNNVDYMGESFEWGGTGLNTGEVAFVNQMTEVSGTPSALITFSA